MFRSEGNNVKNVTFCISGVIIPQLTLNLESSAAPAQYRGCCHNTMAQTYIHHYSGKIPRFVIFYFCFASVTIQLKARFEYFEKEVSV
jgi:hypothetical protein